MTPATLNKRIRSGETFWVRDPASFHKLLEIEKARSMKGKVQVQIAPSGLVPGQHARIWITCEVVKPGQVEEWIPLTAEGRMDWAIN